METQKSRDWINEGVSLTTEGPPQTNDVVRVPVSHLGQNLSQISNYIPPIPVICLVHVALHSYTKRLENVV